MGGLTSKNVAVHGRARQVLAVVGAAILVMPGSASATTHHKSKSSASTAAASTQPGDGCKATPDQNSIGIRALQTELMVAGLKCSAEQWNTFTAKFKTTIKLDADRLQHLFNKTYGKAGASHMNAFVTQLANDASQRSNQSAEADYCQQESVLFGKVLALTGKDLESFSVHRALAVPAPVSLCKPVDDTPTATVIAANTTTGATATSATLAVAAAPAAATSPAPAKPDSDDSPGLFGRLFKSISGD